MLTLPGILQVRNGNPGRRMCPQMLQDEQGWCPAPKPVYRRLLWWLRGLYPHVQCSAKSSLQLLFPILYNIPLPDCSDSKITSLGISTLQNKNPLCASRPLCTLQWCVAFDFHDRRTQNEDKKSLQKLLQTKIPTQFPTCLARTMGCFA